MIFKCFILTHSRVLLNIGWYKGTGYGMRKTMCFYEMLMWLRVNSLILSSRYYISNYKILFDTYT